MIHLPESSVERVSWCWKLTKKVGVGAGFAVRFGGIPKEWREGGLRPCNSLPQDWGMRI